MKNTAFTYIKNQNLKHLFCEEDVTASLFLSCTWSLNSKRLLWNGFMKMIHADSHPGEYSVAFMPMIDLKVNDETRIISTMHFIVGPAKSSMLTQY